jgi:hypothetical protein
MSRCEICRRDGLYFVEHADPDGYVVLACICPKGAEWRTKDQLRAFAASLEPSPLWFGRLEEFFTATEIATLKTVTREHAITNRREQIRVATTQGKGPTP